MEAIQTNTTTTMTAPLPGAQAAAAYLASLAPTGRCSMAAALSVMAERITRCHDWRAVAWATLTANNCEAVLAWGRDAGRAPATLATWRAALRGVAKRCWLDGLISEDIYRRILEVKPIRGSRLPAGRELTPGEISSLLRACANDPTPAGARDAALFAILTATGIRRAEAAALALADVNLETGEAVIRRGKGNKERKTHIRNGAMQALRDWLAVRGDAPGALFCEIAKGRRVYPEHFITPTSLHRILQKRCNEAGVKEAGLHDFRRTLVSTLLDRGIDIATVSRAVGHSNIQTTANYDRRGDRATAAALDIVSVPYFGRGLA